jgi:Domain of unknown function (DUF4145)
MADAGFGFKALRNLSYRNATNDEVEQILKQVYAEENDRGACLLLSADLENALDQATKVRLELTDTEIDEMYGQDAPLGTFSRKISFASAIRIVGPITKHNLTAIRHIRNAFAHSRIPMTFETAEVKRVCDSFKIIKAWVGDNHLLGRFDPSSNSRQRFTFVCKNISSMLFNFSMLAQAQVTQDKPMSRSQFPDFNMVFLRKSLP